jgi:putative DNA primase/helicase
MDMNTLIDSFKQAMQKTGIEPLAEIIADGSLHRFTVAGDRAGSENGWYVLHTDEPAAGEFGCWKRNIHEKWGSKAYQTMSPAEKAAHAVKMETIKRQREEERARIQAICRTQCNEIWAKAQDATDENPYLKRKNVHAFGVKSSGEHLIILVRDMEGNIHGLQFIAPDGSKRFKAGTNKVGITSRSGGARIIRLLSVKDMLPQQASMKPPAMPLSFHLMQAICCLWRETPAHGTPT